MDLEQIWLLDGKKDIEIVGIGKRIITVKNKKGVQKDIRFNKDLEKISRVAIARAIEDAFPIDEEVKL